MKKILFTLTGVLAFVAFSFAQTTVLDFEGAATSTSLQHFGGNLEGAVTSAIDNPNPTGVNTSSKVIELRKASDAPTWGGAFTEPNPSTPVDLTTSSEVCIDVHMDHIGNITLKLEQSTTGAGNWILSVANTVVNDWEQICFDTSLPAIEDPVVPAAGNSFDRVVLFLDFGTEGTGTEQVAYIDNIVVSAPVSTNNLTKVTDLFNMNPTLVTENALITFESTDNTEERQLSIVSALGEVVTQQTIDGTVPAYEVEAANFATGLYFVQVQQGKNVEVMKFMVQ